MAAPAGAEAAAGARGGGVGEDESSSLRKAYILDVNDNKEFQYPDNSIATFKYTLLSFVPVSLFEQFRRVANQYFLFICILMLIGTYAPTVFATPLSPYSTLGPLIVVLAITMGKEGLEDLKRHKSDVATNNRKAIVLSRSSGEEEEVLWKDIPVGAVVKVCNREEVPADIIVLSTSEEKGICYVETSNIDGETNLKIKEAAGPGCAALKASEGRAVCALRGSITYEHPNDRIHNFTGRIEFGGPAPQGMGGLVPEFPPGPHPLDAQNMVLRGCQVRNTKWVLGLVVYTGRDTKVMKKAGGARYKMSSVESVMNYCILLIFLAQAILCSFTTLAEALWRSAFQAAATYLSATSSTYVIPQWLGNWFTFLLLFNNFIPISLYVTVEMVNYGQAFLIGVDEKMWDVDTDTPAVARTSTLNTDLGQIEYVFSDKTGTLTRNIMEFKRASVAGLLLGRFVMDGGGGGSGTHTPSTAEGGDVEKGASGASGMSFTGENIIAHRLAPTHKPTPSGFDDPGAVTLLKGGDLDPEEYRGQWWVQGGGAPPPGAPRTGQRVQVPGGRIVEYSDAQVSAMEAFFTCIAVCHTVVPEEDPKDPGGPKLYQAESPDEAALTAAARDVGIEFLAREADRVIVKRTTGRGTGNHVWHVYGVHQFNSTRKRMGAVVQDPAGRKVLLVKGADNVMLERSAWEGGGAGAAAKALLEDHLRQFGEQGLRTLVMGQRVLSEGEFEEWRRDYKAAALALKGREDALARCAEKYEVGLSVLGASAVEDRLQDEVPRTIRDMRAGGIKVWVLTGDKVETAINIGFSARLLDASMEQLKLESEDVTELRMQLTALENRFGGKPPPVPITLLGRVFAGLAPAAAASAAAAKPPTTSSSIPLDESYLASLPPTLKNPALIVTGPSLVHILADPECERMLLHVASHCKSVLACRVSPAQKANIVAMVKNGIKPTPLTLAIGDGANDVGMIQRADVGVGISGKEGLQAANSADFSIAQFRFLKRLLFVHGRWDYRRMSKVVLYSFYKNIIITLTLFYFNALASFSGQTYYESYIYSVFNFVLGLPIIAVGILDKDLSEGTVLAHPSVYAVGRNNLDLNITVLLGWLGYGILHSVIIFWLPYASHSVKDTVWDGTSGYNDGLDIKGFTTFCAMVWCMQLAVSLITHTWTRWNWGLIAFSQVMFYLFAIVLASSTSFSYEFLGVALYTLARGAFYLNCILVCGTFLLVELTITALRLAYAPRADETARLWESQGRVNRWGDEDE